MTEPVTQDVRTKVSDECHAIMFAVAATDGIDLSELHRKWLHERAEIEKSRAEKIMALIRRDSKGSIGRVGG